MNLRRLPLALVPLICALATPAYASFHLMLVSEVYAGSEAAPDAQYVELVMYSGSQTQLSGHEVIVYDPSGAVLTTATFNP